MFPRPRGRGEERAVANLRLRAALRFACLFSFRAAHSLRSFAIVVRFAGGLWRGDDLYALFFSVRFRVVRGRLAACRVSRVSAVAVSWRDVGELDVMGGVAVAGVAGRAVCGSLGDFVERA